MLTSFDYDSNHGSTVQGIWQSARKGERDKRLVMHFLTSDFSISDSANIHAVS